MQWTANNGCPDDQILEQSLYDASSTSEELIAHIESCATCQTRLESMTTGDSLAGSRDHWQRYSASQSSLSSPLRPNDLGSVGPFAVESVIGSGGMGIVYRGWDTLLHRAVAIKLVKPASPKEPTRGFDVNAMPWRRFSTITSYRSIARDHCPVD